MLTIDRRVRPSDAGFDHSQPDGGRLAAAGMTWIAGGTFQMGSAAFYPEERPVHAVTVGGFWIDQCAVTHEEFARFVEATGYVTRCRAATERRRLSRCSAGEPRRPVRWCSNGEAGRSISRNYANWWAWVPGACWRHPQGPHSPARRPGASPSGPRRVRGRQSLRGVGGQGSANRGGVGVRRARRSRRRRVHLGQRGVLPTASRWRTPGRASSPGRTCSSTVTRAHRRSARFRQRLRAVRHGRQRLGMDERLVRAARLEPGASSRAAWAPSTRAWSRREELRPAPAAVSHSAQGRQRRVALVRAELLLPLPAGGEAAADDRHRHGAHWIPLRRSGVYPNSHDGAPGAADARPEGISSTDRKEREEKMAAKKPNILILWGDDIGIWNISHYSQGMMGYQTPNIDRVANEGVDVHRLVRPAELHGRPCRLHHRPEPDPHRPDQGRHARRHGRTSGGRPDHRRTAQAARLRHRSVRQEPSRRSG